ncbi:MAG: hypothetical protein RSD81_12775 [Pseudomonas sp.]
MTYQEVLNRNDLKKVIEVHSPKPIFAPYFPDAKDGTLHWNRLPQEVPVIFDYPGHSGLKGLEKFEIVLMYNNNDWHRRPQQVLENQPAFTLEDTLRKDRITGDQLTVECLLYFYYADRVERMRDIKRSYTVSHD